METLYLEKVKCDHCGDPCEEVISNNDLNFCCYGCMAVHELLDSANLQEFYTETSKQNQSISNLKSARKFAFLDNPEFKKHLQNFKTMKFQ